MGLDKGLRQASKEHKDKVLGSHFLFCAENPKFAEKNELKLDHKQVLAHLKGAGYDAYEVKGAGEKKGIIIYGVDPEQIEKLHNLASRLGQDSSTYSTGKDHEMRFHHGEDAGKKVMGSGIVWYKKKPKDFYTSLPGDLDHFTHNLNWGGSTTAVRKSECVFYDTELAKAEDPKAYKKLAEKGIMVGFPAKIAGQDKRPDNGIGYHSSVKFFNPDKDQPHEIHSIARNLVMMPPDAKTTGIEPDQFKDRFGNDVHVLKLHGPHADEIKKHNKAFDHMGYPATFKYTPHISVDKKTWDKVKASGAKTAHEAGIEFGPAELRQGHNVLATYSTPKSEAVPTPKPEKTLAPKDRKLAASEAESLDKGFKEIGTALGMAGALASATPSTANAPTNPINTQVKAPMTQQKAPAYDHGKMLRTIASVESNNGKYTNHAPLSNGDRAYGKYGLTPNIIHETISMNPDVKQKYQKGSLLHGDQLTHYMQDNPHLEDQIADKHLARLEHHFGNDPAKLSYAWLEGIKGTYGAIKKHTDIANHWHVKKALKAYKEIK